METETKDTPQARKALVLMFDRHLQWCKRSGHTSLDWAEFKKTRLQNNSVRVTGAETAK